MTGMQGGEMNSVGASESKSGSQRENSSSDAITDASGKQF